MGCSPFLVESNCHRLIIPPLAFIYSLLRRVVQPFQQISGPASQVKGMVQGIIGLMQDSVKGLGFYLAGPFTDMVRSPLSVNVRPSFSTFPEVGQV